jgi:acetyl-CoA carboxylase biotin carboxyl carrier protein
MSDKEDMNTALIRELAQILDETGLTEIEVGRDDWHVRVAKGGQPVAVQATTPAAGAAPATPAPASDTDAAGAHATTADHPGTLTSPMVGVAYMAPEPGAAPFVKVGDSISEGQTVMIIEAMKVFNNIKASRSGKVTRIFVSDGNPVEFGEPLMVIE